MAIDTVRDYLKQWNMQGRIQEFTTSSATVELAAKALRCEPERIAKTLAFKIEEKAIVVVCAGDAKIDNGKYKETFHTKARMLSPQELITMVGHEMGGVCPFGIKEEVKVYLDLSLKRFQTIFPACGSSNSAIELTLEELEQTSGYEYWVDVCKAF